MTHTTALERGSSKLLNLLYKDGKTYLANILPTWSHGHTHSGTLTYDPAALDLCDLPHGRPHGSRCPSNHHSLTSLGLADLQEAKV